MILLANFSAVRIYILTTMKTPTANLSTSTSIERPLVGSAMKVRIGNHVLLPLVLAASLVAGEQASLSESEGPVWGFPIAPSHGVETQLSMAVNDVQVQYEVNRSYTGIRDFFTRLQLKVTPLGTGLIEMEQDFLLADDPLFDRGGDAF